MPTVTLDGPPVSVEKKRELVERLSQAAAEIYGINDIIVIVREHGPDNIGLKGKLLSDMKRGPE